MSETKWTPGPWQIGEYDPHMGYDCTTGGIRVGRVVLDGSDYGQIRCVEIGAKQLERMMSDARLISAAPDLYEALAYIMSDVEPTEFALSETARVKAERALAKARGEKP